MDEALELIKQGARIDGKDGVLAPLIKQLMPEWNDKCPWGTEAVLEAEIESHLSTEINNRKNGKSSYNLTAHFFLFHNPLRFVELCNFYFLNTLWNTKN